MAPVESLLDNCANQDPWVWDKGNKSPDVRLSSDRQEAYFHVDPVLDSIGTAGVRGTQGFVEGEHYWEITFLEPALGTSVMIGVGTEHAVLHKEDHQYVDLIGLDSHSWGLSYKGTVWHNGFQKPYCSPFYETHTVIGVHLDLYAGTLSFYKNGQNLGVAFGGLDDIGGRGLFPLISATATCTELAVGRRSCRYLSLQEKCCHLLAQNVRRREDIQKLPLPTCMKNKLFQLHGSQRDVRL